MFFEKYCLQYTWTHIIAQQKWKEKSFTKSKNLDPTQKKTPALYRAITQDKKQANKLQHRMGEG